jgi:hypothetical protein
MARLSGSERSKHYRDVAFQQRYGVPYAVARRAGRALGLGPGSPASAAKALTTTEAGLALASYDGPDIKRAALAHQLRPAVELQSRRVQAASAVAAGRFGEPGPQAAREAERHFRLPAGDLEKHFSAEELVFGYQGATLMRVISEAGVKLVVVEDLAQRRVVGAHWRQVQLALEGRPNRLRQFKNLEIGGLLLETRLSVLRFLFEHGFLDAGPYPDRGAWAA